MICCSADHAQKSQSLRWLSFGIYQAQYGCNIHDVVAHMARVAALQQERSNIKVVILKILQHSWVCMHDISISLYFFMCLSSSFCNVETRSCADIKSSQVCVIQCYSITVYNNVITKADCSHLIINWLSHRFRCVTTQRRSQSVWIVR